MLKKLLSNTIDACYCGPLELCTHDRENRHTDMKTWMTDITLKNFKNKQGKIYFGIIRNFGKVVLKHYNKSCLLNNRKREEYTGNALLQLVKLPYFSETLGTMYRKSGQYLILRHIDGIIFKEFLKQNFSSSVLIPIVLQMCIALETAQSKFLFGHYDLHLENVIITKLEIPDIQLFDQYKCIFHTWRPVIIDYGMSCGFHGNVKWGCEGMQKKGILNCLRPGYDMYTFFLYLHSILKTDAFVVDVLENFFKHDIKKPETYLFTLIQGAEFKIPKLLFEYIRVNYNTSKYILYREEFSLALPQKTVNKIYSSFIDHMWFQADTFIDIASAISYDYETFSKESIEKNIEYYWKIKQLKLEQYKLWEINFKSKYNKYWKEKLKKDTIFRKKWRISNASEIVNVH